MPFSVNPTGVLLVDDEAVVRAGLRLVINSWSTLHVIGEADTPAEALVAMAALKPNLILCSYGRSFAFLDDLRLVVARAEEVPVVLLAGSRHPQARAVGLQAGVDGVISKHHTPAELREMLERLLVRPNGGGKTKPATQTTILRGADSQRRLKART